MHNLNECNIQIGEFGCSLRFKDPEYAGSVRDYYTGFLSPEQPDLTIDVEIILHEDQLDVPNSLLLSKTVRGKNFDFHRGLLKGWLAVKAKICHVEVKNALFSGSSVRIFEQFLYQIYYTLLQEKYPSQKPDNYLLHACGVKKDGLGYVFTGRSGSGKSTIACLADKYQVLNDEMVIIGKKNGQYQVRSTPFNGEFKTKVNRSAPLRAIFYLRHGDRNYLKPLTPIEFVSLAIREVVVPTSLLSVHSANDLSKMTDFCADLVSEVPCYELYFVPDDNIWRFIEKSLKE
jgi:hypothetical protein